MNPQKYGLEDVVSIGWRHRGTHEVAEDGASIGFQQGRERGGVAAAVARQPGSLVEIHDPFGLLGAFTQLTTRSHRHAPTHLS